MLAQPGTVTPEQVFELFLTTQRVNELFQNRLGEVHEAISSTNMRARLEELVGGSIDAISTLQSLNQLGELAAMNSLAADVEEWGKLSAEKLKLETLESQYHTRMRERLDTLLHGRTITATRKNGRRILGVRDVEGDEVTGVYDRNARSGNTSLWRGTLGLRAEKGEHYVIVTSEDPEHISDPVNVGLIIE